MKALPLLLLFVCCTLTARSESGTLTPRDHETPDPSILSLDEMRVDITIDNGDAHVSIVQIFTNHTKNIEEGTYRFALPSAATVSDFAVWDGPVRIPAVILDESFLSYLGLGVDASQASWGTLLSDGAQAVNPIKSSWWLLIFPAGIMSATLLALNFIGDGLRDALDPRSK